MARAHGRVEQPGERPADSGAVAVGAVTAGAAPRKSHPSVLEEERRALPGDSQFHFFPFPLYVWPLKHLF